MFTTKINIQGTSQELHIHLSKHLNVFQLSKRVDIHSFTSIKCIKTLYVNIVLFLFAFIVQYYSICSTTVIVNTYKHLKVKELYNCIVQRNTAVASSHTWPNRPTFPAGGSSQPHRAACALIPHPEAPVAHSWQDWCTAWHFLPCQSPLWSYRPRSDTVWVLQAQDLPCHSHRADPTLLLLPNAAPATSHISNTDNFVSWQEP